MYKEKMSLEGKTAIVTGGVGILGRKFCAGLAEYGANVVVVDLDGAACKDFAQKLESEFGHFALGVACDVTSPAAIKELVKKTVDRFGEIHILHNNAGGKSNNLEAHFAPFEDYSLEEWRTVMSVNIDSMFLMAQAVGKQMVAQGKGGSIIQTSSIYGMMAPDQRIYEGSVYMNRAINSPAVYAASKAAVVGLTRYLSTYWAPQKIRVNAIAPGGAESGQNQTFKDRYSARIPMGRMGQPEEMVGALVFLASEASSYITGQTLMIDGGLSAW